MVKHILLEFHTNVSGIRYKKTYFFTFSHVSDFTKTENNEKEGVLAYISDTAQDMSQDLHHVAILQVLH